MRFVHTSDWHLGRLFSGIHLTEDQRYVLDQLVELLARLKPDALLISGDIYDRGIPPVEAVSLLEDVLERIVLELGIPTLLIAGNHDDPQRLGFGARFLQERGLHVSGSLSDIESPWILNDAHGPVAFHRMPYAEPAEVRVGLGVDARDHHTALEACLARAPRAAGTRHVLLAHAFVVGGEASESERPLSVGGAGTVDASLFDDFDYVALGHLHRPQRVGAKDHVRYSGSLLKYSFSEAEHTKAVLLVELDGSGNTQVTEHHLKPWRDVRIVRGTLAEVLAAGRDDPGREDYILAQLTNREALLDPMGRLREVYPNVLRLEPVGRLAPTGARPSAGARQRSDIDLLGDFFQAVRGEGLAADELAALKEVLEDVARAEREGSA